MYWQCFLFVVLAASASFVGSMANEAGKRDSWFVAIVFTAATFFVSSAAIMQLLHILKTVF